jgi:hypothetical protein
MTLLLAISADWRTYLLVPHCVLSLATTLAIAVHEIRYARHQSIKARMRAFAAGERAQR